MEDMTKGLSLTLNEFDPHITITNSIVTPVGRKYSQLFDCNRRSINGRAEDDSQRHDFVDIGHGVRALVRHFSPQDAPLGLAVNLPASGAPMLTIVTKLSWGQMRALCFTSGACPKRQKKEVILSLIDKAKGHGFELGLLPEADPLAVAQYLVKLDTAYKASEGWKAEDERRRKAAFEAEQARRKHEPQPAPRDWGGPL